ncbi:MAG: MASE1 domain-containing protein [Planctomycetes bacterium]|nr:MASE1 domain-containing protein [Planctomycetota bacterium]
MPKTIRQFLLGAGQCLLVIVGMYLAGRLGLATAYTENKISLVWLPTGISVAVLYRWRTRYLPVIWFSIVLIQLASNPSLAFGAGVAVGSTLGAWFVALALRWQLFNPNFAYRRDVVYLFLFAMGGMLFSATGGVLNLWAHGIIDRAAVFPTWMIWWTGDTVGVLIAAPCLLALSRENVRTLVAHRVEGLVFVVIFALSVAFMFQFSQGSGGPHLIFLLITWASMRYGVLGGSLAVLLTALMAGWVTATGHGPFHSSQDGLISLWMYVSTLSGISLMITAIQAVGIRANLSLTSSLEQTQKMAADLAAARDEADAASRAKSEFVANMSHEIRTPLTSILGYAELLAENPEIGGSYERRAEMLASIQAAGQHLLTIINDILDLSKIEANKLTIERLDIDLVEALREVERMIRPRAEARGLLLTFHLDSPVPSHIMIDPTRLRQILLNLLGNAVKFTETGMVQVSVGEDTRGGERRLSIEITDTGRGMSGSEIGQLFVEFTQGDATVTRKHGGTGLGLAISRRLARMMGGELVLARSSVNNGSTFLLELPLYPAPGAVEVKSLDPPEPVPAASAAPGTPIELGGRILLAEDCPDLQDLLVFFLTKAGAQVETADHGGIAIERLAAAESRGQPFDLVLTDMQMPEMDGYALAQAVRRRGNRVPIIALTAHSMSDDRQRCLDAGCDDYLTKPINQQALIACCQKYLMHSRIAAQERLAAAHAQRTLNRVPSGNARH